MRVVDVLLISVLSLKVNKLRSLLALLGIVIGVTAVTTLMSIGRGVQDSITSSLQSLGTNLIFVSHEGDRPNNLSAEDASHIEALLGDSWVNGIAPEIVTNSKVIYGEENQTATIVGVTADYRKVRNIEMKVGQFISEVHVDQINNVAAIGSSIKDDFFGISNPVGQELKIGNKRFTVIGVLESHGGQSFTSVDNRIFLPITTAHYRLNREKTANGEMGVSLISVQARKHDMVDETIGKLVEILRERHKAVEEDDFRVTNMEDAVEAAKEATNFIVFFLGSVAGISLLVGGIGIMNIMLVSVTERTREIGVRKALGARKLDILIQFISEAVFLSIGGGLLGIVLGYVISRLLDGISMSNSSTLSTSFGFDVGVLALLVSTSIGLFFGIFPAFRASLMHPIDALRYQ